MRVTVLIPVHNKAPYLRECLDSVFAGTFQDLEVVAVDDASTDDSLAVLLAYEDPRLRVIRLERNLGPAGAANRGLDEARGEYVVRLDADDLMVPERIAKQVAYMDAHPDVGASGGALQLFGASREVWRLPLTDDECQAQLLFGVPVSQGASILRRSVLEAHHLRYDPAWPRIGEDWLFWARMGRVTRFGNLEEPVTLYRRGEQNISHGRDRYADYLAVLRDIFAYLAIPHDEDDLELHLLGLYLFRTSPTPRRLRQLRHWFDRLVGINAEMGLFPRQAFESRVEKAWDGLYHYLPRYGAAVALEHLRLSGTWPLDRLMYLMKYRVKALVGRVANGWS